MLEHLPHKSAKTQTNSQKKQTQNQSEHCPRPASYYAPCSVAQRIQGLSEGDTVTLTISFDFKFWGQIKRVVDAKTYEVVPTGEYNEKKQGMFQGKIGFPMYPSFFMPQERVVPKRGAVRSSNTLILRPDPNPTAISKSVMENGLLVSSQSVQKGIPGKDAFSSDKLSVNLFTAQALSGPGAEDNIHTLFYAAAGGVFPISIERKDNPITEIAAGDIMRKEEMPKLEFPEICGRASDFIEKELSGRKPMLEYYAAKNMLVIGTDPSNPAALHADSAHEERVSSGIAPDHFEYVFYTKSFADHVDKSVRPGLLYREVTDVVNKTIVIPLRYFFWSSDVRIAQAIAFMSTFNLVISVPDYEGSLKAEKLLSDRIYFSHVVRL